MIVIAVANTKGGVGKTTLCASLAVAAEAEGARVGLIDLDPQRSLERWRRRRLNQVGLTLAFGAHAQEHLEDFKTGGFDYVLIDAPPAFIPQLRDCVEVADLVVIPLRPSMLDLMASSEAVSVARAGNKSFLCVLNGVDYRERKKAGRASKEMLFGYDLPIADTVLTHRKPYVTAMAAGQGGSEARDDNVAEEVTALWAEVKAAANEAAEKPVEAATDV